MVSGEDFPNKTNPLILYHMDDLGETSKLAEVLPMRFPEKFHPSMAWLHGKFPAKLLLPMGHGHESYVALLYEGYL